MIDVITHRAIDSHPRSIAKALSWRTLGSIDTFVLSWIITGNFVWAGSIASLEVFTKMVLYYLHERGWSHIKWGVQRASTSEESVEAAPAPAPAILLREVAEIPVPNAAEVPIAMRDQRPRRIA
jgi:uncharacterized membrane protein